MLSCWNRLEAGEKAQAIKNNVITLLLWSSFQDKDQPVPSVSA